MARRTLRLCAVSVIILVMIGICGCAVQCYVDRLNATKLLLIVANIELGVTKKQEVKVLARKYARYDVTDRFSGQSDSDQYDEFLFRNWGLAMLGLAPQKNLSIELIYNHDVVVEKSAHFMEAPNHGGVLDENSQLVHDGRLGDNSALPARQVLTRGSSFDPTNMISIRDDLSVPVARRRSDWNIDLSCMTKFGACGDFRQVFKGAFE